VLQDTGLGSKLVLGHEDLMEPVLYPRAFTAPGWIFEMKVDGFRALARSRGGKVSLISRTGRELGAQFPEVISALASIPGNWHLDAELVVPDGRGHPDWERLRRRSVMRRPVSIDAAARAEPAALCVSDMLTLGRSDLRDLSTEERKARLARAIPPTPGIQIVSVIEVHGEAAFAKACELDLEGVVAKRSDAPYQPGKRPTWRKIRNQRYSRQADEHR
jgi:bifunctional non-homologous end joining protein LigD